MEPVYYWHASLLQNMNISYQDIAAVLLLRLCIILELTCLWQNPVGAGRYDIQKFEEAQHRNGHQSDFKSKTGRLTHAYEKFLRWGYFCCYVGKESSQSLLLFLNFCSDLCLKAWFIVQKNCWFRYSFTDARWYTQIVLGMYFLFVLGLNVVSSIRKPVTMLKFSNFKHKIVTMLNAKSVVLSVKLLQHWTFSLV